MKANGRRHCLVKKSQKRMPMSKMVHYAVYKNKQNGYRYKLRL